MTTEHRQQRLILSLLDGIIHLCTLDLQMEKQLPIREDGGASLSAEIAKYQEEYRLAKEAYIREFGEIDFPLIQEGDTSLAIAEFWG